MPRVHLAFLPVLLLACDGGTPTPPPTPTLFPVGLGFAWEFQVTKPGDPVETKLQTVTGTATHDGKPAFVFTTESGSSRTVSVQLLDGTKLVRAGESSYRLGVLVERVEFEPPALRVDTQPLAIGTVYESTHVERHYDASGRHTHDQEKTDTFTVEAVDERVTVPAGTYSAFRIRRATRNGASKTFWFAPDVGKIQEVGGQTEALVRATLD